MSALSVLPVVYISLCAGFCLGVLVMAFFRGARHLDDAQGPRE